jgi:hypothetical protein
VPALRDNSQLEMTWPLLPRINLISLITKQSSKVILTYALSPVLIDRDNFDFRHSPKHQRETQRQGDRRREVTNKHKPMEAITASGARSFEMDFLVAPGFVLVAVAVIFWITKPR